MSVSLKIALAVDGENSVVGDLYIENGTVRLTRDLSEEVAQQLYIRLKTFLGEWFLDSSIGFPWFQSVLGIKVPLGIVAQIIRKLILATPGVASIQKFSIQRNGATRFALVQFTVILTSGAVLVPPAIAIGPAPNPLGDYTPAMPEWWEDPIPSTQFDALDRIAYVVYTVVLGSTPIPAAGSYAWLFRTPTTTQQMIDRLALGLYEQALDASQIPLAGAFSWAGSPPVTIMQKIDRLATTEYVHLFDSHPIP
jgi:hypothetical protein